LLEINFGRTEAFFGDAAEGIGGKVIDAKADGIAGSGGAVVSFVEPVEAEETARTGEAGGRFGLKEAETAVFVFVEVDEASALPEDEEERPSFRDCNGRLTGALAAGFTSSFDAELFSVGLVFVVDRVGAGLAVLDEVDVLSAGCVCDVDKAVTARPGARRGLKDAAREVTGLEGPGSEASCTGERDCCSA